MLNIADDDLIELFGVSREVITRLKKYQQLVFHWNNKFNLISASSTEKFWLRHIIDSLQLLKFIAGQNISLIDVGSGAGLPGVVLSIAGIKKVTLIESQTKKAAFLLQAAQLSDHKITIINQRAEAQILSCDILTARALGDLNTIFAQTKNIIVSTKYLLPKGHNYQLELTATAKNWRFDYIIHDSLTRTDSKILEISNLTWQK